jgi:hypothetical protein
MPNILTLIADNTALSDTLRAVLEKQFMMGRTDDTVSDVQLGQEYRARLVGLKNIDLAFKEIATHKTRKEVPRGENPAR